MPIFDSIVNTLFKVSKHTNKAIQLYKDDKLHHIIKDNSQNLNNAIQLTMQLEDDVTKFNSLAQGNYDKNHNSIDIENGSKSVFDAIAQADKE